MKTFFSINIFTCLQENQHSLDNSDYNSCNHVSNHNNGRQWGWAMPRGDKQTQPAIQGMLGRQLGTLKTGRMQWPNEGLTERCDRRTRGEEMNVQT